MEILQIRAVMDHVELARRDAEAALDLAAHHRRVADHRPQARMREHAALGGTDVAMVGVQAEAELLARRLSLMRVIITLSNDNIPAQYFYQRRGYRLTRVLPGVIAAQPRNAGLLGFADIPIVDEIQLSKDLQT